MSADSSLDTIVAPATPQGRSALAIVRIDGPASAEIVAALSGRDPHSFIERQATRVLLRADGKPIDDCLVIRYQAPRSFTGNDLVEVITHGSWYLVERLVRAAVERGARIASPGEFSERAVLNGKMDLVQAEAVADLIQSRTALQASLSLANLEGALSASANSIRADLLRVISRLEAGLDFAEEGYEFITASEALEVLASARRSVEAMLRTFDRGRATASGLSLVILGQPNAGKSTLMNILCGSERAIVTEVPGTTRDLLRETLEIGGLPVTVIDTAGLRSTEDRVEQVGVERARAAASDADLVLYLVASDRGLDAEDRGHLEARRDSIVVFTKADLAAAPPGQIAISATTGMGLQTFLDELDRRVRERFAVHEREATIVNERQHATLSACEAGLVSAMEALENRREDEVVLVDLYRAATALGELTGAITTDDVLTEIFAKFCIGK